jgi:hypothetical protein
MAFCGTVAEMVKANDLRSFPSMRAQVRVLPVLLEYTDYIC